MFTGADVKIPDDEVETAVKCSSSTTGAPAGVFIQSIVESFTLRNCRNFRLKKLHSNRIAQLDRHVVTFKGINHGHVVSFKGINHMSKVNYNNSLNFNRMTEFSLKLTTWHYFKIKHVVLFQNYARGTTSN